MTTKNLTFHQKRVILKKAGLIGGKNHDLRNKKTTPAARRHALKKWSEYSEVLTNENVKTRYVSKNTASKMRELGYKTHGRKVWVDTSGYDRMKIKKGKVIFDRVGRHEEDLLLTGVDLINYLKKHSNRKAPPGQFLTVRIGDNPAFRQTKTFSYKDLEKYISNVWIPKKFKTQRSPDGRFNMIERSKEERDAAKIELVAQMRLVTMLDF